MKKYRPSNGTEGMCFIEHFCCRCIHEKFMHTNNDDDLKCDILDRSMLYEVTDKEYPEEWTYDVNDQPTCTAFKKWDWGRDDGDGLNEPPVIEPEDPNQLCLPFIFDELEIPKNIIHESFQ